MWDEAGGAHLETLKGHSDWIRSVVFSPDGTRIASESNDYTVRLWDAVSGAHLKTLLGRSCWLFFPLMAYASHQDHMIRPFIFGMQLVEFALILAPTTQALPQLLNFR